MACILDTEPRNRILRSLPARDLKRLQGELEPVRFLKNNYILFRDQLMRYIYFPNGGAISVTRHTEDGQSVEIASVGSEGLIGLEAVMGAEASDSEALVHVAADGFRLKTIVARKMFLKCPPFQAAMLRYARAYFLLVSQNVVCGRLHPVEQRLARCLLRLAYLTGRGEIATTQESLCSMLGASRPSVSTALAVLQQNGLVALSRGSIAIRDNEALARFACECHTIVKAQYDRLKADG